MYIPNDDIQITPTVDLVVETFGHSTKKTNQSKSNKVPKVVKPTYKKFWGLVK